MTIMRGCWQKGKDSTSFVFWFGSCVIRWQRRSKAAQDVEYPAYGITGPGPSSGKSSLKSSPSTSNPPAGGWGTSPWKVAAAAAANSGDKKLAHSAHMFHFQHQKQQVIAMERYLQCIHYWNHNWFNHWWKLTRLRYESSSSHAGCERRGSNSGAESDEDNEEGDYTVYECPGLAPVSHFTILNTLLLNPSNKPFCILSIWTWIDGRNGSEESFIPRRPDSGNSSSCQAPVQVINNYTTPYLLG